MEYDPQKKRDPQGQFKIGVLDNGGLGEAPDFLAPMLEDELATWEGDAPPYRKGSVADAFELLIRNFGIKD